MTGVLRSDILATAGLLVFCGDVDVNFCRGC